MQMSNYLILYHKFVWFKTPNVIYLNWSGVDKLGPKGT